MKAAEALYRIQRFDEATEFLKRANQIQPQAYEPLVDLGFNTKTKDESTTLNVFYGLGFARDRTNAGNPFPILAVSLRTAGAYSYPT